ncbi:MAG: M20 family metallopeptidase [Chloroflexi bacterium]|nr:M20 family metallopeptidase [Chloroflexota bacterium]MDA1174060.1 M20 family metallopeptidase [Chloroflexota bacterium]
MSAKSGAQERLDGVKDDLVALSRRIHDNPELGYEEEKASGWLADMLDGAGFKVERGICDLPTAFKATIGSGPLHIAICAEYDALPSIGHACGHNVIAASSVGAAIAAAAVADDVGLTISVIGTPAEEVLKTGGKILLLDRGAFDGMHAAMMAHPAPWDVAMWPIVAASFFEVHYTGKAAHAAGFPDKGVNAADAITIAQTSIGLLRQHLRPSDRVHGIVTKGGDAFNIIPANTSADFAVRARTLDDLGDVYEKVMRCFEAGALATGATLEIVGGDKPFAHMEDDVDMAGFYQANAEALGRTFPTPGGPSPATPVSTDMGNVSLVLPSIHPALGIDCLPAVNHQPEFADATITPAANQAIYDGALSLAWTAIDMASTPEIRDRLLAGRGR